MTLSLHRYDIIFKRNVMPYRCITFLFFDNRKYFGTKDVAKVTQQCYLDTYFSVAAILLDDGIASHFQDELYAFNVDLTRVNYY